MVTVLQCENYQVLKKGPQGCTVHLRCLKREMKINWLESTMTLQVVQLVPRARRGKNIFWIPLTELKPENTCAEGEIRLRSQHKARGFAGFLWTLLLAVSNISARAPSFRGSYSSFHFPAALFSSLFHSFLHLLLCYILSNLPPEKLILPKASAAARVTGHAVRI